MPQDLLTLNKVINIPNYYWESPTPNTVDFCQISLDLAVDTKTVKWVEYVPNRVNEVRVNMQDDVLSGPFTGCYMIRYRLKSEPGFNRVCHVATDTEQGKTDWKAFQEKNKTNIEIIHIFKPSGADNKSLIGDLHHQDSDCPGSLRYIGLSTQNEMYSIILIQQRSYIPVVPMPSGGICLPLCWPFFCCGKSTTEEKEPLISKPFEVNSQDNWRVAAIKKVELSCLVD